jgi:hypothetical protein
LIDLIIYYFTSNSRIFHIYGGVTIIGEGLQNLGMCSGAQGPRAGRDLYRATPAVTRGLGFPGLIRRTAPFNRLLRLARGCRGPSLTRIRSGKKDIPGKIFKQKAPRGRKLIKGPHSSGGQKQIVYKIWGRRNSQQLNVDYNCFGNLELR